MLINAWVLTWTFLSKYLVNGGHGGWGWDGVLFTPSTLSCCNICSSKDTEAETKWPPFSRRHFILDFLQWKCLNFDSNFTEVCCYGSNQQYSRISWDNGLAPPMRQAVIWNNDGSLLTYICVTRAQLSNSWYRYLRRFAVIRIELSVVSHEDCLI